MQPLWETTEKMPEFKPLENDIKTDVLIVGGGITGLLCAYFLQRAGIDCAVIEAEKICGKVTAKTTAKITFQHGLIYDSLIKKFGLKKAKLYLEANKDALEEYEKLCRDIDCNFEKKDAYVYSLDDKKKIDKEISALAKIGYSAEFAGSLPLPFSVAGAVKFKDQAQFNPVKFLSRISSGLTVYENTPAREFIGNTVIGDKGKIYANKIIMAAHFPIINKHGLYFLKMYQHRSYVTAFENAPDVGGMYVDADEKGMSFRNYENLLFVGGGDHRTGKQGGCYEELRRFAAKNFPEAKEKYHWATQDCMTLDGVPYIGKYSPGTPDLYVATGFNKWGMTSSMAAAKLLTDMIKGKKNRYEPLFSPSRSILHPQLFANAGEALINIITPSEKRCPHMGCALKWNSLERTWDCPCHGSRFTERGILIDNPATGDLYTEKNDGEK